MTAARSVTSIEGAALSSLDFALAGVARVADECGLLKEGGSRRDDDRASLQPEARVRLLRALESMQGAPLLTRFFEYLKQPQACDKPLVAVSRHLDITMVEALALRLAVAAEEDIVVGHLLAVLQHPPGYARPTVGLLARAYGEDISVNMGGVVAAVQLLAHGAAAQSGLIELLDAGAPLPERQLRVPLPTCMALAGLHAPWPGTALLHTHFPFSLGAAAERQAELFGHRLQQSSPTPALVLRSGDSMESRAAAERVASACARRAVMVTTEQMGGLAPWLFLGGLLPVFSQGLSPGERCALPAIPSYHGPLLILSGADGEFISDERPVLEWRLAVPSAEERYTLWAEALGDEELAHRLAVEHRHSAGRIAALAVRAQEHRMSRSFEQGGAQGENGTVSVTYDDVRTVSRRGEGIGLAALAELVPDEVPDEALVVSAALRQELESLVSRCLLREGASARLGPAMQARARASVRALLVGPSGTGKTLAASWLATRLGLPLFRVDLAAITSKYIGETEKNLSQLLTRAEQSEVVLLFDEADSLFARRTDVRDANDRFANSQTNYLLQRMENYEGITLLTSNSRSRFDSAFSRRLDLILEFPLPSPEERRDLWLAHLGDHHSIAPALLNRVSVSADLSGGQIRNVVLAAAVTAGRGSAIEYRHLLSGLMSEYRKLSRQLPEELRRPEEAGRE